MAIAYATASGNWSNTATWSGSYIPQPGDDVWANGFNVNIDQSFSVESLNNTARARDIATPQMSADNIPTPYVAAASTITAGRDAWRAFDRTYTTNTGWSTAASTTTGWLSMDFGSGSATVIDGYTIYGTATQAVNPRHWALQGSNDNTSWTNLHIVSGAAAIAASSTYSVASIGNSTGYRYYRVNVTLNGTGTTLQIVELELYQPNTVALASGGSFIFNSGSISGSCTSTTTALAAGATNLIQVTATTGSVTLNLSSNVSGQIAGNLFLHSGNCDLTLNGQNFSGGSTGMVCINKTSAGTITINGNLSGGINTGPTGLVSNNGNTVIIGNVTGTNNFGINQSAGNLTVTGNITTGAQIGVNLTGGSSQLIVIGNITGGTGGSAAGVVLSGGSSQFTVIGNVIGGTNINAHGISFSGVSGSVTGNMTGGAGNNANGVNSTGAITVTGNVTGGTGANANGISTSGNLIVIGSSTAGTGPAINTASNISMDLTGTVTATSVAAGLTSTSTGTVNLSGNMINVGGKQAIFAQNLFIDNTTTSQWRLFTPGSQNKTLYSADTFPNLPTSSNVRSGSIYGPGNTLSGSMIVPSPSDVRINVPVDNTVGTATSLTAADFLNEISSSSDAVAQRFRTTATDSTVGSLLTGFNNGGF
jgi:hypothetical protein